MDHGRSKSQKNQSKQGLNDGTRDPEEDELADILALAQDLETGYEHEEILRNQDLIHILDEMRKKSKGGVIDEDADRLRKSSEH